MRGDKDIVQCTYVDSPLYADKGVTFFASNVTLGVRIVPSRYIVPSLTRYDDDSLTESRRFTPSASWLLPSKLSSTRVSLTSPRTSPPVSTL